MKIVLEYLEKTADIKKDKIAVIEENKKITYDNLLKSSKIIGSNLISELNEPIIVFMDKGIETLCTFFGVLYSGACYSLINPEFPEARIKQIKEVLNSKKVITNKENLEKAKSIFTNLDIYLVEELLKGEINEEKLKSTRTFKYDIDPVYINFTSGSTGVPKGVVVSSRSIIDFIDTFTEELNIKEDDVLANQAPFDFDVSVKDIFSSMKIGATLLIVPKKYFSSPALLLDYLTDNKATTLIWAVSALCLITTFHGLDYKVPSLVNKIIYSGEVMPYKHLKEWMDKLPNAEIINVYGPTEITCNCTYHKIDRNRDYTEGVPIGKAFKNEKVFLLNEQNELVTDINTPGEVCVSGTALSLGYYNNKEVTSKNFMQNPLNKNYIEMIYRTGDLAIYNENYELVFKGRKDFQIKYMGHRIELEEIDKEILKVDGVKRVVTLFNEKKHKLWAFYVGDATKEEIIEKLKKDVPIYMIPSIYKKLDEFKLTKNGKIDRNILKSIMEDTNGLQ